MEQFLSGIFTFVLILFFVVGCNELSQPVKSCKLDDISENLVCLDGRMFFENNGTYNKVKPSGFRISSKCECK